MKKQNFLSKLKRKDVIELVDPSKNITNSYLEKSKKSLKSAKVLIENKLYEDSISKTYYSVYHSLLALLFRVGIKCENHTASIIIFKELFDKEIGNKIKQIKKERIRTDYYTDIKITKKTSKDLYKNAENITIKLRNIINNLNQTKIKKLRNKLKNLLK